MTKWVSHTGIEESPRRMSRAVNTQSLMWLPLAIVKSLDLFQLISSKTWPESSMSCLWIKPTERWGDTTAIKTERNIFQDIQQICFLWIFYVSLFHTVCNLTMHDIVFKLASLPHEQCRSSNLTYISNCTNRVNLWSIFQHLISESIIAHMFSAFSDILLFELLRKGYWNAKPDCLLKLKYWLLRPETDKYLNCKPMVFQWALGLLSNFHLWV